VPKEFVDPPSAWNPTVALFFGGYALAALSIWGWFVGGWPLPLLLICGFLALHLEGTVVHDACHNAAHPVPWMNQAMGHGSALLLGFSFPVFTRVHLQHHSHVNDPKNDPDHIVSTFGPLWLIAPRFFLSRVFLLSAQALEALGVDAVGIRASHLFHDYRRSNSIRLSTFHF
jgi:beta-carotene hydroxylase